MPGERKGLMGAFTLQEMMLPSGTRGFFTGHSISFSPIPISVFLLFPDSLIWSKVRSENRGIRHRFSRMISTEPETLITIQTAMNEPTIKEVVRQLKTALWPTVIYRFNYPEGRPSSAGEQDLNLCVIVPDDNESPYHKSLKAYNSLRKIDCPKTVIVRHESDFKKRSRWLDSLEWEIARTGEVLYEPGTSDQEVAASTVVQQFAAAIPRHSCP